eukprot:6486529-Amphidinium_carterae.2
MQPQGSGNRLTTGHLQTIFVSERKARNLEQPYNGKHHRSTGEMGQAFKRTVLLLLEHCREIMEVPCWIPSRSDSMPTMLLNDSEGISGYLYMLSSVYRISRELVVHRLC